MISNHSIDVEAERKLFEAAAREEMHYDDTYFERFKGDDYAWREVRIAFKLWLAAKRSIAANTGTIDTPEFRQLLWNFVGESINEPDTSADEDMAPLIAHIDARLNAAEAK